MLSWILQTIIMMYSQSNMTRQYYYYNNMQNQGKEENKWKEKGICVRKMEYLCYKKIGEFVNYFISHIQTLIFLYKLYFASTFSMMINNNPYNLPERPPNKTNRIYTQGNLPQYRTELIQNSIPFSQSPQYIQRPSTHVNGIPKKNSITGQQAFSPYRQPYTQIRNQIKHFLPSPKNQGSTPSNINNLNANLGGSANLGNRGSNIIASSLDKKQLLHTNSLRESIGKGDQSMNANGNGNANPNTNLPPSVQLKQLNDKIQLLIQSVKSNEKRIQQLQRNSATVAFLPNNSKITNQTDISLVNSLQNSQGQLLYSKFQSQLQQQIQKLKQEVLNETKFSNDKLLEKDRQKFREMLEMSKNSQVSLAASYRNNCQELKKQIEVIRVQLEQKIKKNHEFLTSVISRVERQFQNGIINIQPNFKPSSIKCSSSAILLRFVQCFKVRKNTHSGKNGQIKITLTDNTYYIDSEGYLLDKEQFYLVDAKGHKIKLQERHVKLLKQQSILM